MGHRGAVAVLGAVALAAGVMAPADAQSQDPMGGGSVASSPGVVVAQGLDSPRHMAFGPDGSLYVANAGIGGTDPCVDTPEGKGCFGPSGSVTRIAPDGTVTTFIDGLPSMVGGEEGQQDTLGPSAIAFGPKGQMYLTVGGGGNLDQRTQVGSPLADDIGWLLKVSPKGKVEPVADLLGWEANNNPDADQPSCQAPGVCSPTTVADSDINGVAVAADGTVLVADAGANDLVAVDKDGKPELVSVFPVTMTALPPESLSSMPASSQAPTSSSAPAEAPMVPTQAVPTSVTIGPDGAYYIGFLTGFPFPKGGAWVARVEPGQEPTVYASGFTNVMDLAFEADGSLLVLEISHNGLTSGDVTGGLWKVPPGGGEPELVMSDGLVMPGGIAVDQDGNVYVSQGAVSFGQGSVVKLPPQ